MSQASLASVPECKILEPSAPPPSRETSTMDLRTTLVLRNKNPKQHTGSDPSLIQNIQKEKTGFETPRSKTPDLKGARGYQEEMAPSPNTRLVLTRLQERKMASPTGCSSAIKGPANHSKDGAASKKHRTT